jgi:hypothetical protein
MANAFRKGRSAGAVDRDNFPWFIRHLEPSEDPPRINHPASEFHYTQPSTALSRREIPCRH